MKLFPDEMDLNFPFTSLDTKYYLKTRPHNITSNKISSLKTEISFESVICKSF